MTGHSALIERLEAAAESASRTIMGRRGQSVLHPLLAEAAAALRDLTEWRDIATAPKDGKWIQAWREPAGPNGGAWEPLVYVRWDEDGEEWVWPDSTYEVFTERGQERANRMIADYENFADNSFTHWLPLPSAPNQAKALK